MKMILGPVRRAIWRLTHRRFTSAEDYFRKRTRFGEINEFLKFQVISSDQDEYTLPFLTNPFRSRQEKGSWSHRPPLLIALDDRGVSFVLERREEMLSMLRGEDLLGIVPEDIPLGYNHGDFPEEDKIHSFIHLTVIEETCGSLPDSIAWYPLETLSPAQG